MVVSQRKVKKTTTPNHALQHGWALSVMIFIFNDTSLQASFYLHLDKVGFSIPIPMLVVSIFLASYHAVFSHFRLS